MSAPVAAVVAAVKAKPLAIGVLYGSTRDGRFGIQLANAVVAKAKALGHTVTLFDAKTLQIPLLTKPFHHYQPTDEVPAWLAKLAGEFDAQDAFITVDGEYNHGPTPGLINMLDHFYHKQYKFKAAAIAGYGAAAGGARSSYVLRNTLGELGLVVAPTGFTLPNVWAAFDEAGAFKDERSTAGLDKFLTEFEFLAGTLAEVRKTNPHKA